MKKLGNVILKMMADGLRYDIYTRDGGKEKVEKTVSGSLAMQIALLLDARKTNNKKSEKAATEKIKEILDPKGKYGIQGITVQYIEELIGFKLNI